VPSTAKGSFITVILMLLGLLLAQLSGYIMPLGYGVSGFWLPVVLVVNGTIWFGGWGLLAAIVFPVLASLQIGLGLQHSLSVIAPNLIEGLIPALAFRLTGADRGLQDRGSLRVYILWAVLLPSLLGGLLAGGYWWLQPQPDRRTILLVAFDWAASNCLVLSTLGIPTMYLLAPLLRPRGLLVPGWWRFSGR
jgi:hypothetical protein